MAVIMRAGGSRENVRVNTKNIIIYVTPQKGRYLRKAHRGAIYHVLCSMALAVFDKFGKIDGFVRFIKEECVKTWTKESPVRSRNKGKMLCL